MVRTTREFLEPMKISFYANLRQITGGKSIELDLPRGTTVRGLLQAVVDRYPELREKLFDEDDSLFGHIHVFVNGRDAPYLDRKLATELEESDTVDIFPPVGGG